MFKTSQDIRLYLWKNIANYSIARALNYDTRNEFLPPSEWLTALSPGRAQRGAPAPDPKDVTRNEHALCIFSGRLHSVSFRANGYKESGSQLVVLNRQRLRKGITCKNRNCGLEKSWDRNIFSTKFVYLVNYITCNLFSIFSSSRLQVSYHMIIKGIHSLLKTYFDGLLRFFTCNFIILW